MAITEKGTFCNKNSNNPLVFSASKNLHWFDNDVRKMSITSIVLFTSNER